MKGVRHDRNRLHDILDAIARVRRHQPAAFEAFDADEENRYFTLKQVEIIGEAVFKMSAALKAAHPEVPWQDIEKTRHVFVHDYFAIEWQKLWSIVTDHLDPLREQIEKIVSDLDAGGPAIGDRAHD
jgi:uncharacterized protein with HEPN domain